MNSIMISATISIFYVLLKMVMNYKESPNPNLKDGMIVFLCSMVGLYASDYIGKSTPQAMKVFTEIPSF